MKIATLQLLVLFLLVGCATKYNAPDSTKMDATAKVVQTNIQKAHDNAKATRIQIKKAQVFSDKITEITGDVSKLLDQILAKAPIELKPPLQEVKSNVEMSQTTQKALTIALADAWQKQSDQDLLLTDTKLKMVEFNLEKEEYKEQAANLAIIATKQSEELAEHKRHKLFAWLTLGAGGILCIVFVVLKFFIK